MNRCSPPTGSTSSITSWISCSALSSLTPTAKSQPRTLEDNEMVHGLRSSAVTKDATGAERTERTSRCEPQSVGSVRGEPWLAVHKVTAESTGHVHRISTRPWPTIS
jgi:hypothetical protein